ncbi:MAG: hypothetical protein ABI480_00355 [Chitinophagaceae bacterium]
MKMLSRKRIGAILSGIGFWLLGILLEDPVKKIFYSVNISFKMNLYILTLSILFAVFCIGLVIYWKITDSRDKKRAVLSILLEEVQKSQIAARYNLEVIKDINRILQEKVGKEAMLHGLFFPEVAVILQNFSFQSLELLNENRVDYLNDIIKKYF